MIKNSILILMVILMPIRSWAAESMDFPVQNQQSINSIANGMNSVAMPSHCAEMAGIAPSHQENAADHTGHAFTNACALCMAFAFTQPQPVLSIATGSYGYLVVPPVALVSADLALNSKPPIL